MSKKTKEPAAAEPGRRGRPPLENPEQVRDGRVAVKVSTAERDALEAGAAAVGKPLGLWLRELGLAAAKRALR
jgi:uncharacterized protein (DUF1778 family)